MNNRRFDLIGLGECMVELSSSAPLGNSAKLDCSYGGDVLNALVAAARAGACTGFITRVGNDPFGAPLLSKWRQENIDVKCAPLVGGENGVYFISLLIGGEREFTYRRQNSAASFLQPSDLDEDYIASASCLLVSGITQAISVSAQLATLAACEIARRHGVKVAYDPNYRERLWGQRGGVNAARAAWQELLPYIDFILPSFPSDMVLLNETGLSSADVAHGFGKFSPEVAQKCGENGSCVYVDQTYAQFAPSRPTSIVDTTGAGDTWNGIYLFERLRGLSVASAAETANQQAAMTLAHRGAIPKKTLGEGSRSIESTLREI